MSSQYSICIPRIEPHITKYIIFNVFRKLFIGRIGKIDIVTNKITKNRRAFIHYKTIYNTEGSREILKSLDNKMSIRVVYDFPNYWKCYKSTTKKSETTIKNLTREYIEDGIRDII